MTNLKPCGSRLLVQPDPVDNEVGGIILPYETSDTIQSGTIIAVGPDASTFAVGQRVLFARRGPQRLTEGDNEYLTMLASEVWFVIEPELVIKPTILDDIYKKWGHIDVPVLILCNTPQEFYSINESIFSHYNEANAGHPIYDYFMAKQAPPESGAKFTIQKKEFLLDVCPADYRLQDPTNIKTVWYNDLYK